MAKQPSGKGGNAHIRLIVLDAVIPEGDVGQIAQALQNALRPPTQQRVLIQAPQSPQRPEANGDAAEEDRDGTAGLEEFEDAPTPLKRDANLGSTQPLILSN